MQQIYAKPYAGEKGTYKYHISECYRLWRKFFQSRKEALAHFCNLVGMSLEDFQRKTEMAILFHDAGKLLPTFQQLMKLLIEKKPVDRSLYFRHELASALLMFIMEFEVLKNNERLIPCEILAVLGHHKSLQLDWHAFEREKNCLKSPSLDERAIQHILQEAEFNGLLCNIDKVAVTKIFASSKWPAILFKALDERLEPTVLDKTSASERKNIRLVYALIKGLLKTCDWLASAENENLRLAVNHNLTSTILRKKLKDKIEQEGKVYEDRPFHNVCEKAQGNILAIAPTGAGKTEASLLWATNGEPAKIIFLMPTKVTSNSLYERMSKYYFGKRACGLIHSGADTYFAEQDNLEQDNTLNDTRLALRQFQAFMAPVMVATVDQMLSSGFNIGLWCQKEWALVGSRVIIDEIHAYQPYTLGLITAAIEKIKLLGGKICLMSATMPAFLRKHFQNVLGVSEPIVAKELMNRQKCYWEYRKNSIDEMTGEIQSYLQQGKKVAVVFNTVRAAQKAYCKWKDKKRVLCYHSQFIMKERQDKEAALLQKDDKGRPNNYDLVFATQTIEVSLDISFDVMYSECAPLDSLIQRAGRCNRYNVDGDHYFIVFPVSEIAFKKVYKKVKDVIERTMQVIPRSPKKLSEEKLGEMLEYVYRGYELNSDNTEYQEGYCVYDEIATAIDSKGFIFDLSISEKTITRKLEHCLKVNIIPQVFYEEVKKIWERRKYSLLRLYEVPVYEYYRKQLKQVSNPMQLPIYEVPYTEKEGILGLEGDDFPARSV